MYLSYRPPIAEHLYREGKIDLKQQNEIDFIQLLQSMYTFKTSKRILLCSKELTNSRQQAAISKASVCDLLCFLYQNTAF